MDTQIPNITIQDSSSLNNNNFSTRISPIHAELTIVDKKNYAHVHLVSILIDKVSK